MCAVVLRYACGFFFFLKQQNRGKRLQIYEIDKELLNMPRTICNVHFNHTYERYENG